jgi:cobalt-zinc-cadmium efflux system membrane fusion protein
MRAILLIAWTAACLTGCSERAQVAVDEQAAESAGVEGPNGGRLLVAEDFSIELAIFEAGVPPEYHAWAALAREPVDPREVSLVVELGRLGGGNDRIQFAPADGYLRGDRTVTEPHSFDVRVTARHAGVSYDWEYESYEGRTTIPADIATAAGIATATAGPGTIEDTLTLYGAIAPDLTRARQVQARFPGVIRSVSKVIGDSVRAGDALAVIESNESLQSYTLTAPIAGVVTARTADPGEQAGADALFEIADFSVVWGELDVFPRDRPRVRVGQSALVRGAGGVSAPAAIQYLAPTGDRTSQSVTARIVLDNAAGVWTPGQFVEADVTLGAAAVDLAVPLAALQTFRDFDVVFARVGDTYEVRMVQLGRRDAERVEILSGLAPGTQFVVGNSYLVKADIEKSGASHDH